MKKISQQQIEMILREMFELNIPVKSYEGVRQLFAGLPSAEEKDSE